MWENKKEPNGKTGRKGDERIKKQHELDERINIILDRVQVLAETGCAVVESNRNDRMLIVPVCCAIQNEVAELGDLVLEYRDVAAAAGSGKGIRRLRLV